MTKYRMLRKWKRSREDENWQNNLNVNYTFNNFIKSSYDDFAYKAAKKVAENFGERTNNPLIIYSAHTSGKTYLLHAIGNKILKDNHDMKVLYISAEEFFKEFVDAMKKKEIENFRERFCTLDCLLMDDIQFLSGKDKILPELFSIIKILLKRRKQIVLSADQFPLKLGWDERLSACLMLGLIAEIKNTD